jgi:hypothetical protein
MELCERWMARQTVKADQWLVIDDDRLHPTKCTMGQEYHRIPETLRWLSLPAKIKYIFDNGLVKGDVLIVVENDDWYAPDYVEKMVAALKHADLVGEGRAIYYHVRWRSWWEHGNLGHASLCSTAMTRAVYPFLHKLVTKQPDNPFVDCVLWREWKGTKRILGAEDGRRCIGMKCMPGTTGYVGQHTNRERGIKQDPTLEKLFDLIGWEAGAYSQFYDPLWEREPDPPPNYTVDAAGQMVGLGGE